MPKKKKPNQRMQGWIDARKRHHLSHAQVQMARELGMNPKKLGKKDNQDQEPWKMPCGPYIEHLYGKRFGKERPDVVLSVEEKVRRDEEKKARRREAKLQARQAREGRRGETELTFSSLRIRSEERMIEAVGSLDLQTPACRAVPLGSWARARSTAGAGGGRS